MRNIVCIGGSSGVLEAIRGLVRRLQRDLPAAVFIVRHIAHESPALSAEILKADSALPVTNAIDGEAIKNGRIDIGPANQHLLLEQKNIRLKHSPKENRMRPAIDPLFRTSAQFHGPHVIGILLRGKLDDGTAGLWAIKRRGGLAVVQDTHDALSSENAQACDSRSRCGRRGGRKGDRNAVTAGVR